MTTYICSYKDNSTADFETDCFICQADDAEHAREQCENAYPSAFITDVYAEENQP